MEDAPDERTCLHEWESGFGWGVIIGVSKCAKCGDVAKAEHFAAAAAPPKGGRE
jgi:hypothetical protein